MSLHIKLNIIRYIKWKCGYVFKNNKNGRKSARLHFKMVEKMKKSIITVVGKDTVGIIAKVCTYLADNNINILDISQTIVQGYFNMMMIVDATSSEKQSGKIADELAELGEEIGVQIKLQQEDIFNSMHRI